MIRYVTYVSKTVGTLRERGVSVRDDVAGDLHFKTRVSR